MNDFLMESVYEGLTSRLKRLSDALLYSTKDFYKSQGLDIEPNWNLVFRLLQSRGKMTVGEISETLQFSHPAVVKIVGKMKEKGYVASKCDDADKRKQLLTLTEKGVKSMPTFELYWEKGAEVVKELLVDSPHFMAEFLAIEKRLNDSSYKERILQKLGNDENTH